MTRTYCHEALLYEGNAQFLAGTVPFIKEGIAAGERIYVVVRAEKIALLTERLGDDAAAVEFADMAVVGNNPARIIPAWRDFLDAAGKGAAVRGVGEATDATRSPAALVECCHHEALFNLAFSAEPLWMLCPYDVASLAASALSGAGRTHQFLRRGGTSQASESFSGVAVAAQPPSDALEPAPARTRHFAVDGESLSQMRRKIVGYALAAGLSAGRAEDLQLAVNELLTNSIVHGGGSGVLRIWASASELCCEVRDPGEWSDPLVGRVRPPLDGASGRGIWLVNQLCDLVQMQRSAKGSVVRLVMNLH